LPLQSTARRRPQPAPPSWKTANKWICIGPGKKGTIYNLMPQFLQPFFQLYFLNFK
jgi:hypothetical protein